MRRSTARISLGDDFVTAFCGLHVARHSILGGAPAEQNLVFHPGRPEAIVRRAAEIRFSDARTKVRILSAAEFSEYDGTTRRPRVIAAFREGVRARTLT